MTSQQWLLTCIVSIMAVISSCSDTTTNNYYINNGGESSEDGVNASESSINNHSSGPGIDYCAEHAELCAVPPEYKSGWLSTCYANCSLDQIDVHQDESCISIVCNVEDGCWRVAGPKGHFSQFYR